MRATILTWIALLSVMTGAIDLHAQESRPEFIGSRVRVTLTAEDSIAPSQVLVGRLVGVGDSALLVRAIDGTVENVAMSRIQRFEVSTGRNRLAGAKLGALVGFGAGLVVGFALGDDCGVEEFVCFDRKDTAAGGSLIGAALGMSIGLIAGRGDRWAGEPVPARVSVVPVGGGGFRLAASFTF